MPIIRHLRIDDRFLRIAFSVALATGLGSQSFADDRHPQWLSQTGLYGNAQIRSVNSNNLYFSPQYPLWSDGARKRRWISIPSGQKIDTSNMDQWVFPVGTRVWKEFSYQIHGVGNFVPVETRLLEKAGEGDWRFSTYVWTTRQNDARRAPEEGIEDFVDIGHGVQHDVPGRRECTFCHGLARRRDMIAGFDALQLSPKRDPDAIHGEALPNGAITLRDLITRGLVTHAPQAWPEIPVASNNPLQRRVFGYFHGNCASCHSQDGYGVKTGLFLRQFVVSRVPWSMTAFGSTVDVLTRFFQIPEMGAGETFRIRSGNPQASAILFRMRYKERRMPPVGTELFDDTAVHVVEDYIRNLRP